MPSLLLLTLTPTGSMLRGYAPLLRKVTLMVSPTSAQMTGPRDKENCYPFWYITYRIFSLACLLARTTVNNILISGK